MDKDMVDNIGVLVLLSSLLYFFYYTIRPNQENVIVTMFILLSDLVVLYIKIAFNNFRTNKGVIR